MNKSLTLPLLSMAFLCCSFTIQAAPSAFDQSFFSDYSRLAPAPESTGSHELMYIAPGAMERLARSHAVILETPTVLTDPESDFRNVKPSDVTAIAALLRKGVDRGLSATGLEVVNEPGPGIIRARLALTDLRLQKKKRKLLAYTPVGAVLKAGLDATRSVHEKYDVLSTAMQIELLDSATHEVLAQIVTVQGGPHSAPMDFAILNGTIQNLTSRLGCRLDDARGAMTQQTDCRFTIAF